MLPESTPRTMGNQNKGVRLRQRSAPARARRRRKLPPGQRLMGYLMLASLAIMLQSWLLPADDSMKTAAQHVVAPARALQVPVQQPFQLTRELADLEGQVKKHCAKPRLRAGAFVVDPATGISVDRNAREEAR